MHSEPSIKLPASGASQELIAPKKRRRVASDTRTTSARPKSTTPRSKKTTPKAKAQRPTNTATNTQAKHTGNHTGNHTGSPTSQAAPGLVQNSDNRLSEHILSKYRGIRQKQNEYIDAVNSIVTPNDDPMCQSERLQEYLTAKCMDTNSLLLQCEDDLSKNGKDDHKVSSQHNEYNRRERYKPVASARLYSFS